MGIYFKPQNQKIISSVLYEYIDTSDQSGISVGSGFDGYFGNNIYRSGWTYEQNVMGAPFVLFDKDVAITEDNSPFISNRSKVHHFGLAGGFKNFQWKIKSTYAKYLGTYRTPFYPEWKYWYNYASLSYKTEKYDTWDWNYGKSPKFNIQRSKRFPIGEIDLRIYVEKGHIKDFKIFGDFFGKEPIENLEKLLQGARYEKEDISELLKDIEVKEYFGDIPKIDFIELVYGADEEQ